MMRNLVVLGDEIRLGGWILLAANEEQQIVLNKAFGL